MISSRVKDYFEGISQALFFKNAYFGFLLVTLGLLFNTPAFIYGIIASLVSFFYSVLYRTPKILKQSGLMTINGFFFGIAFATFFKMTALFYFCFLIGSFAVPLVTKASFEILQHWKLSPLILPYILTIWILSLCSSSIALPLDYQMGAIQHSFSETYLLVRPLSFHWMKGILLSMSQIFFFRNSDFGLCLFFLIAAFSPRRGIYFFLGTGLATLIFYGINPGAALSQLGYFSFSAGLVGLGLASLPENFNWRTIGIFCTLSLFLTIALEKLLSSFGLPLLSFPFVITFWFALLSRAPRLNVGWAPSESI